MTILQIIAQLIMVGGVAVISIVGMLSAFWPINDQETSVAHRVFTLIVALAIIVFWVSIFK